MSRVWPQYAATAVVALTLACGPVLALDLKMPAPIVALELKTDSASFLSLPTGVFTDGVVPQRRIDGAVDQRAWRLEAPGMSLTQLSSPLRKQLEAQGFTILLDCEARACGGFDFRFAIDVMTEPAMHVDLGEFRYLSATRGDEAVSLLISRSSTFGFVQMIRVGQGALPERIAVGPDAMPAPALAPAPTSPEPADEPDQTMVLTVPQDLVGRLVTLGSVPLDDLIFDSGAASLAVGNYPSLDQLAAWLEADANRSLVLVGHTDASGGLAGNIALSKQRAEAVRQALLRRQGVRAGQVTADGVGPFAPRATNLTEEGRTKNRRVEAVLTSTQ